jgi:hypothetical protein
LVQQDKYYKLHSGAGANPSWGSVSSELVSTGFYRDVGSQTLTATSPTAITTATFTVSGTAGDKIIIHYSPTGYQNTDDKATQFDLYMTEQGGSALSISTTASGSGIQLKHKKKLTHLLEIISY